jgi:hypothetical protein
MFLFGAVSTVKGLLPKSTFSAILPVTPGVVFSEAAIHVYVVVARPHKPHRCPG